MRVVFEGFLKVIANPDHADRRTIKVKRSNPGNANDDVVSLKNIAMLNYYHDTLLGEQAEQRFNLLKEFENNEIGPYRSLYKTIRAEDMNGQILNIDITTFDLVNFKNAIQESRTSKQIESDRRSYQQELEQNHLSGFRELFHDINIALMEEKHIRESENKSLAAETTDRNENCSFSPKELEATYHDIMDLHLPANSIVRAVALCNEKRFCYKAMREAEGSEDYEAARIRHEIAKTNLDKFIASVRKSCNQP